jgi:hypothetical protein
MEGLANMFTGPESLLGLIFLVVYNFKALQALRMAKTLYESICM